MSMTINEAAAAWTAHLTEQGLKEGTVLVYKRALDIFIEFFGADKELTAVTVLKVNGFMKSNALLKSPKGKPLAKPTLDRSKRVYRQFLQWCVSAGHLAEAPVGVINLFKFSSPKQ